MQATPTVGEEVEEDKNQLMERNEADQKRVSMLLEAYKNKHSGDAEPPLPPSRSLLERIRGKKDDDTYYRVDKSKVKIEFIQISNFCCKRGRRNNFFVELLILWHRGWISFIRDQNVRLTF